MNKALVAKFIVKGAISVVVSAGIGYAIKGERHVSSVIDEYFTKKLIDTNIN